MTVATTTLRVRCDKHPHPWVIADFIRTDPGVVHRADGSVVDFGTLPWIERRDHANKPSVVTMLRDDQPTDISVDISDGFPGAAERLWPLVDAVRLHSHAPGSSLRAVYDLTCQSCRRRRRHATVLRREEKALWRTFDEMAAHGLTWTTPEFLLAWETRRDHG